MNEKHAGKSVTDTYKGLFKEAPVMYAVTQERGGGPTIVECNRRLAEKLGYSQNKLVNTPLSDIYSPESREKLFEMNSRGEEGFTSERQLVTNDGDIVETLQRAVPKTGSGGELMGHLRVFVDISERKREERRLESKKDRMEKTHSLAYELASCNTENQIYRVAVESAEEILDIDTCSVNIAEADHLVRKATSSGIPTDTKKLPKDEGIAGQTYQEQEALLIEDTEKLPISDGEYVSAMSVPIGELGVFQAASRKKKFKEADLEIAELLMAHVFEALNRIKSEQEVQVRDRFVSTLVRNIPGMIYRCRNDRDWTMEFVSEGSTDVTGYEPSELVQNKEKAYADLIHSEDRDHVWEKVQEALEEKKPFELVYRIETASGERKWVWEKGRGVYSPDNEVRAIEGFITDITARRTRKQRLEVLNRVLRHNLRNDLNVVMGRAEILKKQFDDPALVSNLDEIIDKTSEVVELGNKAREIERLLKYDEDTIVNIDLVDTAEHELQLVREEYDAEIETDMPEEAWVIADRGIEAAVAEIIENAVDHNTSDNARIEVSISSVSSSKGDWWVIEISDNGPGIPEHEREVLLNGKETDLQHGSGLGLWLVNWVVSKSNGELLFEDNEPEGSTVSIKLRSTDSVSL